MPIHFLYRHRILPILSEGLSPLLPELLEGVSPSPSILTFDLGAGEDDLHEPRIRDQMVPQMRGHD